MKVNFETLYRRVGLLLHAEASRHRPMTMVEYLMLLDIVEKNWVRTNSPMSDHLNQGLHEGLKDAFRQSMHAGEAMQLFQVYYATHACAFDDPLKNRIIVAFREVANAFAPGATCNDEVLALKELLQPQTAGTTN